MIFSRSSGSSLGTGHGARHTACKTLLSSYGFAILSGLLLAAAFPNWNVPGLAWIAPALMLVPALGKPAGERFRLGYVAGLAYHLARLYWLLLIPYRWHGIPFGPAAGWLALSAYVALYQAVWVWLLTQTGGETVGLLLRPFRRFRARSPAPGSDPAHPADDHRLTSGPWVGPRGEAFLRVSGGTWVGRSLWALYGACLWVALEFFLGWFISGFPWGLLGASQYRLVPLIQVASLTGVYGVSFLMVWVGLSLLSAGMLRARTTPGRKFWVSDLVVPMLTVAIVFNLGLRQLARNPVSASAAPAGRTVRLTLVQPSIPQTLIWDPANDDQRITDLITLSEQALTNRTDILVWPEAAVPKLLRYDKEIFQAVTGLARKHKVWMILGADDAEPLEKPKDHRQAKFFNSSFLISPEGELMERYKKRSLVIFGEYIPLERWLPFLSFFTPIQGGFTPGDRAVQFEISTLQVTTSVLICFEDIFPPLGREAAAKETDFLVNLTNNGWFGEGAAQWQHGITGVFRAVENNIPLIRCSNNGLTCWVDNMGRLRDVFRDSAGTIYGVGFMNIEVPLTTPGQTREQTFYNRHGDWFAWLCSAAAVCGAILRPGFRGGSPEATVPPF